MADQMPPDDQQDFQGINIDQSQISGGVSNQSGQNNKLVQGSGNTWIEQLQVFLGQSPQTSTEISQRSKSEQILLQGIRDEVEERLKHSLHNHIYIALDQEKATDLVDVVWHRDIKSGVKTERELLENVAITKIFDETRGHRLLILGEPGSGKTTTLLTLAKTLIERAETDTQKRIPVLLNLSSWQKNQQSITDWIIYNLKFKYGIRPDIGKRWLEEKVVLPLLDGLDELKAERQDLCIQKVNEFLSQVWQVGEVVICSRTEEYELQASQFVLNGSVILQPLTKEKIKSFLLQTDNQLLWETMQQDEKLLDLMKKPLLLDIIVVVCQEISFEKWRKENNHDATISSLMDAYIARILARKCEKKTPKNKAQNNYSDKQVLHWLGWLAWQLTIQKQTEFFIEYLQPNWLDNQLDESIYKILFSSIVILISGILGGLGGGTIGFLSNGLVGGLIVGAIVGIGSSISISLIFKFSSFIGLKKNIQLEKIETIETLNWSWKEAKQNILVGLRLFLGLGFLGGFFGGLLDILSAGFAMQLVKPYFGGLSYYWIEVFNVPLLGGILIGLISGLTVGLIFGILGGLRGNEIEIKKYPNQGIIKTSINALVSCLFGFSIGIGIYWLIYGRILAFSYGTSFLLIALMLGGGFACIQHITLRMIMHYRNNIPWNYAHFLNDCTEHLFLQRVGGGYRFIHRFLQEHLATQYEASLKSK